MLVAKTNTSFISHNFSTAVEAQHLPHLLVLFLPLRKRSLFCYVQGACQGKKGEHSHSSVLEGGEPELKAMAKMTWLMGQLTL